MNWQNRVTTMKIIQKLFLDMICYMIF